MDQRRKIVNLIAGCMVMWGAISAGAATSRQGMTDFGGMIPDILICMPEKEYAIIVEKKTQTLSVWAHRQGAGKYGYQEVFKAPCSTGEVAGPKSRAGDKKTPEGVYFLQDEYEDRYLTPIYGKKAFPTDYPNCLDHRLGNQGSAIWIHGTNKVLKPMDSNGCIALENDNVVALSQYIHLNATPLIIVEEIAAGLPEKMAQSRQRLTAFISGWIAALETGTYQEFQAYYETGGVLDITWWNTWSKWRDIAAREKAGIALQLENTGIYVHNKVVVAIMDMYLAVGKVRKYLGKRQLFIGGTENRPVIIGDCFQKKAAPYETSSAVLLAAVQDMVQGADDEVLSMVTRWLAAWSAKDMTTYASFYADTFFSQGLGKGAWMRQKKQLAGKYDYINVTGSDYRVNRQKDGCVVSFLQDYRSSGFAVQGRKEIRLIHHGGVWKINHESWTER